MVLLRSLHVVSTLLRRWLHIVALLGSTLLLCACAGRSGQPSQSAEPPTNEAPASGLLARGEPPTGLPVEADDGVWGDDQAPVTIAAFLDFECPFCARGFQTLRLLQEEYGPERIRIVVKHLPLQFHRDALPAAIAAQAVRNAAGNQAFFAYVEMLMANSQRLDAASLAEFAEKVGVERQVYNEHVDDEQTLEAVARDLRLAHSVGVTGTPAFFINGRLLAGAQPIDSFRELIDAETRAMVERMEKGENWSRSYAARVEENLQTSLSQQLLGEDPATYRALIDESPSMGKSDALVTLVAFSDFECPFCKQAHTTVQQLQQKYGDKLRVVFKHLPLHFHARAQPAAHLADAVYEQQGSAAFWKAVDRLFAAAPDLSDDMLVKIGTDLGLSSEQAMAAVQSSSPSERLQRDADLAADLKANGTPHFFINGKRVSGAQPLRHFAVFVDAALEEAEGLVASGVAPGGVYDHLMQDAVTPGAPQKLNLELAGLSVTDGRPSRGRLDAPVVIHVFSDFQCPFCRKAEQTLVALEEKYAGRLRIQWHNLPLPIHSQARPAARAAEEAFAQGGNRAFWKMHNALFNMTGEGVSLSREDLEGYAKQAGLDLPRFRRALDEGAHEDKIIADEEAADRLGIQGTPAFVIGGYLVKGAQPLEHFERIVDRVLETSAR